MGNHDRIPGTSQPAADHSVHASSDPEPEAATPTLLQEPTSQPLCLSLDLEINRKSGRIRAFGAVRSDTGQGYTGGGSASELLRLDDLAEGVSFLLGHNLIDFDLPHLAAAQPGLRLLKLPVVDTLRLSPLAFPRNPYHGLVKHCPSG